ncbi:MAG: ASCH domain-containing protein [Candidatus Edwardsbacteria bacterium]|nr:ASCH domain-containing protein [Candidatus Edwardsbacteria bacterium]
MIYKCLSIVKPNGNNVASGIKTIEVRRWELPFFPLKDLIIIENDNYLSKHYQEENGMILAMADVIDVRPWEEKDLIASCAKVYEKGYLAWILSNIRKISYPAPVPAKRKIYELELDEGQLEYQ